MKDIDVEVLEYYLNKQPVFWQRIIIKVIDWLEGIGFNITFEI